MFYSRIKIYWHNFYYILKYTSIPLHLTTPSERLLQKWLKMLPKSHIVFWFPYKVTTVLSGEAQTALISDFGLDKAPDVAVLSNWILVAEWDAYDSNGILPPKITFLLLRFSQRSNNLLRCTSNNKVFPEVVSSLKQLITVWDNFTEERYRKKWFDGIMQ